MNGFIAIISTNKNAALNFSINWKEPFYYQPDYNCQTFIGKHYQVEQCVSTKFEEQRLCIETDDYLCITEGVILNLKQLCSYNAVASSKDLITKFYSDNSQKFFNNFEGNFCGIFHNKRTGSWTAFNNKVGTKKVFYYCQGDYIIIASDLKVLSQALRDRELSVSLDEDAAYLMLTAGFMHENLTLLSEVKQLRAGEYCEYTNIFQVNSYFHLQSVETNNHSKDRIIENLDVLFRDAIQLEFEIDKLGNNLPLTTLSGGLDSRMTALIAHKMGYTHQQLLNFSNKGYADQVIAKKIADSYSMDLTQLELEPQSLMAIDESVLVSDGLLSYSGGSHVLSILNKIDASKIGLIHTGIIGDAVMGSFVSSVNVSKPKLKDGLYTTTLFAKTESFLKKHINNYPSEELYKFYNRAFLGANNGFRYFDLISESTSPFLYSPFLAYAYSIPRKYKFREQIYVDWIKALHPDIASFTWEAIGGKPTNNEMIRFYYRYKRAVIKRLPIKTIWKGNMNTEQAWYDRDLKTKQSLDKYFDDNIAVLDAYSELKNDVIELYRNGDITDKAQALTLLSAYKLHFG